MVSRVLAAFTCLIVCLSPVGARAAVQIIPFELYDEGGGIYTADAEGSDTRSLGYLPLPDRGKNLYYDIYWTPDLTLIGSYQYTSAEFSYLYWDYGMNMVWGNEFPVDTTCTHDCVVSDSPGHALLSLHGGSGRADPSYCSPASGFGWCATGLTLESSWLEITFRADRAGPQEVYMRVADSPAIPEPSAWALMIVGFGMVGSALRRGSQLRRRAHRP
ncbi:MAG: hypothetical protein JWQ29_1710 [Phenylobacterium sp.]|nr:hypothetical protein [Phenylobacterium sp.]